MFAFDTSSLSFAGTLAIQNDKTSSSRASRENIVLSASTYAGPEKTFSKSRPGVSLTYQKTIPAFHLESSRSVNDHEGRFAFTNTNRGESIDELTSSKHVAHIDGNNIEVKAGEYYQ